MRSSDRAGNGRQRTINLPVKFKFSVISDKDLISLALPISAKPCPFCKRSWFIIGRFEVCNRIFIGNSLKHRFILVRKPSNKNFLQLMSKPCPEIPGIGCSALKSKKF